MKASSESGECASLISTVSFSVFEAACWPDMGLLVSFQVRTRSAWLRPALILQETTPRTRGSAGDEREKMCVSQGLAKTPGRTIICSQSLTYWRAANHCRPAV